MHAPVTCDGLLLARFFRADFLLLGLFPDGEGVEGQGIGREGLRFVDDGLHLGRGGIRRGSGGDVPALQKCSTDGRRAAPDGPSLVDVGGSGRVVILGTDDPGTVVRVLEPEREGIEPDLERHSARLAEPGPVERLGGLDPHVPVEGGEVSTAPGLHVLGIGQVGLCPSDLLRDVLSRRGGVNAIPQGHQAVDDNSERRMGAAEAHPGADALDSIDAGGDLLFRLALAEQVLRAAGVVGA